MLRNLLAVSILLLVGSDVTPASQGPSRRIVVSGVTSAAISGIELQEDRPRGWYVQFRGLSYKQGLKPAYSLSDLNLGAWLLLADGSAITPGADRGTLVSVANAGWATDARGFSFAPPKAGAPVAVVLKINDHYHVKQIVGDVAK